MSGPPVQVILGVENAANPFEVLGLPIGMVTESDIIDALGERMQLVAKHPMSETPEGNEVRLAIHAAAAQLLDERIREALLERAGVTRSASTPPPARRTPSAILGPRALMVIASEGGWNQRAMRRLAMLAHAEGIASSAVPEVVRSVASEGRPHHRAEQQGERQGRVPRRMPRDAGNAAAPAGLTALAAAIAIVLLALTWFVLAANVEREPSPAVAPDPLAQIEPGTETVADDGAQEPRPPATGSSNAAPLDAPDWASALVGMRDAKEPADAATVKRVIDGIAETWPDRSPQDVRRIATAFVDVAYLMPPDEGAGLVASMADQIRGNAPASASFHAGLLARLSIERSLPTTVENAIVAAMVSTIGSTQRSRDGVFVRGAARALGLLAAAWSSEPPTADGLGEWLRCADAVRRSDPRIEGAMTRDALEAVLRSGRDPLADAGLLRVVEALAGRLDPASDSEASGLVLRVLADSDIDTRAASVLVNALARAAGADAARLSPAASQAERADVRAKLAQSWVGQTDPAVDLADLRAAVARHLTDQRLESPQEWLADAAVSARLSNGCRLVLWGSPDQANQIVATLRDDIDRNGASGARVASGRANSSDAWAVRYLEAKRNIPVRLSLLGDLVQRRGVLGIIGAELVVAEAINGSPASVRREAQNVVMLSADQPAVINAALELLPTVPRVRSVQELIEQIAARPLPAISDPGWPFEARRAVVDRLLEVEAASGNARTIDELAQILADEQSQMLSMRVSALNPAVDTVRRLVQERLDEVRRIDLAGNASVDVDRLMRLLSGRLAMAEGSATSYAAYQTTAVELLAEIISLEAPHLRDDAFAIVRDLTAARLEAQSVFQQMSLVERASLRLWNLRVGVEL